jgi:hypothetical protein
VAQAHGRAIREQTVKAKLILDAVLVRVQRGALVAHAVVVQITEPGQEQAQGQGQEAGQHNTGLEPTQTIPQQLMVLSVSRITSGTLVLLQP